MLSVKVVTGNSDWSTNWIALKSRNNKIKSKMEKCIFKFVHHFCHI